MSGPTYTRRGNLLIPRSLPVSAPQATRANKMVVEKHHKFMDPASNVSSNPFHKPRPVDSEFAEKLEVQKVDYEARIAHMEKESKSKLEKTIKHYEAELREEEKHGDWLLKEMWEGHETVIAEIKKEHALEFEAAQEDYEADLGRLNQSPASLERAFADQSLELAELKETKTKETDFLSKSAEPGAEAKDAGLPTDKKADTNDKKAEIDALTSTIDALKDTVGIQMVAAEDLRETIKDLRERNAKLEAELQKK